MKASGKCLCGAVGFTLDDPGTEVHCCHCSMCRRWSGSPALAVSAQHVTFSGEDNIAHYESSDWAERGFCKKCGSNLFYRLKEPGTYFLLMGSFDDQSAFRMASEIYIDNKPPGYEFVGDHPRLTEEEFLASIQEG